MKQFETREELLQDAINYFWGRLDRRCVDPEKGNCMYIPSETSEGCAIGRLLPIDIAQSLPNTTVENIIVFDLLPEWMKAFDIKFLSALQECHDRKAFANRDEDEVHTLMFYYVNMTKIVFPSNN